MMRALSLWQPWASAIAIGAKRVETRSWGTAERGPLAIHAAKKWNRELAGDACFFAGFCDEVRLLEKLPLGAVVCVAELGLLRDPRRVHLPARNDQERALGGWEPGRWGWVLEDKRQLKEPFPLRGQQGLWTLSEADEREVLARAGEPCAR